MKKLLLIDDDERLAEPLKEFFKQYDLELKAETHPLAAIDYLSQHPVDLIILDVMLPEIDGFETCKRIRRFSDIPIIMLTARGDVMDRVVGLEIGADDYLPKPFEPRELVARIQSILKRVEPGLSRSEILKFEGLIIETEAQRVILTKLNMPAQRLDLTAAEYRLLLLLARHPEKIFSRDDIMLDLKGIDADIYSRAIDVLISRLRQKLQPLDAVKTIRSLGYQFILPKGGE